MSPSAPRPALPTRRTAVLGAAVLGLAGGLAACSSDQDSGQARAAGSPSGSPDPTASGATTDSPSPSTSTAPSGRRGFGAGRDLDATTPSSTTVLVNKHHPLTPVDWAPEDLVAFGSVQLRREAAEAARSLFEAAARDGVVLTAISGYRSHATQQGTYRQWVSSYGRDRADVASARPGHSEHQTGLAMDLGGSGACDLQPCFEDSPAAQWAAAHALEHGFLLRFPWQEQDVTGYWFESWHLRYVGKAAAGRFRRSGAATLEDFLGSEPAPRYSDPD